MATDYPDLFEALMEEFHPEQTRVRAGSDFTYITTRAVMNRLDKVVGPENWEDDYQHNGKSVLCRLTLTMPDGRRVQKCGSGCNPEILVSNENAYKTKDAAKLDDESAYAEAFKRAGVKFGIGRYLYNEGLPVLTKEQENTNTSNGSRTNPVMDSVTRDTSAADVRPNALTQAVTIDPRSFLINPKEGTKEVWTWILEVAKYYRIDAAKLVAEVARKHSLSNNHSDWDAGVVARICTYLRGHAKTSQHYKGEFDIQPAPTAAPTATEPYVDPQVKKAQDEVWHWATWLANQRLGHGEVVTDPQIMSCVFTASGGKWNRPFNCHDINALDAAARNLKNASPSY